MSGGDTGDADHEFGAQHTDLKLSLVEDYLKAFTTVLRPHFKRLWYYDAFAGTGVRTVRVEAQGGDLFEEAVPESIEQRRGSAQIAIDIHPAFDRLVFTEHNPRHFRALQQLKGRYPDRVIDVFKGDANDAIVAELSGQDWGSTRAVMFLDPYGMNVSWETLKAIRRTEAIDVWYLFPLAGLYRQAAHDIGDIDAHKRAALTRLLGTKDWENELYAEPVQKTLFDPPDKQRQADVGQLENYVHQRLRTLFPAVLKPLPLPVHRRPQHFSLFFSVSNPEPSAIGLATRIANHILRSSEGISSQSRPR